MRKTLLIFFLLIASLCFAQSPYPDPLLGARPGAFSARAVSLGHTMLTDETGPASLMGNPATLADQEKEWRVDVTADVSRVKEIRKYPVYDSFNASLFYNNYAINDHLYSRLEGGLAYRVPTDKMEALVLSLASYSAYRFDYTYHEEVRNRGASGGILDKKLGENRYDVYGDLRSITAGAAARNGLLALGFSVSGMVGSWNYERGVFYADEFAAEDAGLDSLTYVDRAEYSPNGMVAEMSIGATLNLGSRVVLGMRALIPDESFKFKRQVSEHSYSTYVDSTSFIGDVVTVSYPKRFGGGLRYQPRGEYRPVLLLEGDFVTYSDVQDNWDDTFELRAGAEQQIVPGAPVRVGFTYSTAPQDEDRATTLFTAGIGFTLQKLHGDFGVELGKLNYTNPDLFPQWLYGDEERVNTDRVETALFRGIISLRYDF